MTYGVFYISPELYRAGVTAPFDNLLLVCGALLSYMCLWNMAYEKGLKQFSSMTGILSVLSDLEDIEGE